MDTNDYDPALAAAISLTPIDAPNQYLGGRTVSERGAESIINHFVAGVPCEFHLPDGDVLFTVEELRIDDGQLVARVAAACRDDMARVHQAVQEDVEPAVRMDLKVPSDPDTRGIPDQLDEAILVRVHVDLQARH